MSELVQPDQIQTSFNGPFHEPLKGFIDFSPFPIIVFTEERCIYHFNAAFSNLVGFPLTKLVGSRAPFPFWLPEKTSLYTRKFFHVNSQQKFPFRTDQNQIIWVLAINKIETAPDSSNYTITFLQDITAQQSAQTELKESRRSLENILDAVPMPMSISSFPDGVFLNVNEAFVKTSGYSRKHFIGLPSGKLNWQDEVARDTVRRLVSGKKKFSEAEIRILSRTGKPHVALLSARAVKFNNQEATIAVSVDITKMKKAEQALRESEAFNASLLRDAPNPILVINLDNSIRFVNPAFIKMTGFSKKELLGARPPYPWWPNTKTGAYSKENQDASNQEINGLERKIWNKKKESQWISISTRHVIEDGCIKYFVIIWTDITQRKNAEETLREAEQFNSTLLNDAPNPILVRNADGTFKYANPAFEKLTGYRLAEFVNTLPPAPWWPPDKVDEYRQADKAVNDSEIFFFERLFHKKDGTPFWVNLSVRRITDNNGSIKYYLANWVDVTERKQREEKLHASYQKEKLQREELEEEARLRGHFINILAHELRTPITPILASTDMLKGLYKNKKDSLQKKLVDNIANSASTLTHRLEELLEMARHARGAFKLNIQPVDLKSYFNGVIARFKPSLDQHNQKLVVAIPASCPSAELDASRLEQVFVNLLSNASKFSADGSSIYLTVQITGPEMRVDIRDNGIGIDPDAQRRLFQPYYRVEQDRHQFPGLGLGLAVSKQIIDAHGGQIWVVSEKGQGSTFSFKVPLKNAI
jgi:PAS domain S-box-containing protein